MTFCYQHIYVYSLVTKEYNYKISVKHIKTIDYIRWTYKPICMHLRKWPVSLNVYILKSAFWKHMFKVRVTTSWHTFKGLKCIPICLNVWPIFLATIHLKIHRIIYNSYYVICYINYIHVHLSNLYYLSSFFLVYI